MEDGVSSSLESVLKRFIERWKEPVQLEESMAEGLRGLWEA